ncbi:MAG: hypothetical protein P4L81_05120 [Candidatus Pacebacteria bacterium]|nr:hypothetical protein [Candidatus Paceibacterota bacterium]
MKVKVEITPVTGNPHETEVEVPEGSSVEEILKAANCGTKGFNLFLNNEPVQASSKVDSTITLKAVEIKITATERVAGS